MGIIPNYTRSNPASINYPHASGRRLARPPLDVITRLSWPKALRTSRWRTDALFQCRCNGIGIMHRCATGPDALPPGYSEITPS